MGIHGKWHAFSDFHLHKYVGVMGEKDPGKDFHVILMPFSDSENREVGLGADNYAEKDICSHELN